MHIVLEARNPIVLSYVALRRAVGGVALGLPFVLAIPWGILHYTLESSISGYYYTGMRNLFVGSLCAISMFMFCSRGYDWNDEVAGILSSICALGVAFFPTAPDGATQWQQYVGVVHYIFAGLLFSILAYFCLVLFKMSAETKVMTRQKVQRNRVYTGCGWAIVASMALILVLHFLGVRSLVGNVAPTFCFESTALIAFGIAWLTKGESFLKDETPQPSRTVTTDSVLMIANHRI